MYVFFDPTTFAVTFTANGSDDLVRGRTDWIEVPNQDLGPLNCWSVIDGALVITDLAPMKLAAIAAINAAAGEVRRYFVSDLPGQDMVYLRKEEEARKWLAEPGSDIALFPFLQAEVGVTAETPDQLCQVWLNLAAGWLGIAALIEHLRFAASAGVQAATTPGEVDAVMAAFHANVALFGVT